MKDVSTAAKLKCADAFEIAVRNCIAPPQKGEKRRRVNISEADSRAMYDFYIKHTGGTREQALSVIGSASRRAAMKSPLFSVIVFAAAFLITLLCVFHSLWPMLCAALLAAAAFLLLWKPRRVAQKIWAGRKAFPRGTEEALEKMCLLLSMPLRAVSLPLLGGLLAATLVCLWQTVALFL